MSHGTRLTSSASLPLLNELTKEGKGKLSYSMSSPIFTSYPGIGDHCSQH